MNSLLTLAKTLEQKSKEQQQSTGQMLKTVFSAHEKSVSEALNSSVQTINGAIEDHNSRLSESLRAHREAMESALRTSRNGVLRMTGRTWLTITLVTTLLTATCAGVLWYQGTLIASNLTEIGQQREALSALNAKTWGVSYQEQNGERYLVLPAGTSGNTAWTVGEGKAKRNAIRLEKE